MPRNAAGVYALPDPPRVPNTVIDSPDENITRDDIAVELTNSLDRNGRGGMLAPFRIADGTLAAPGLAFLNEPGSGLYRIGAGDWALAVQGAKVMEFTPGTVTIPAGVSVAGNVNFSGIPSVTGLTVTGGGMTTGGAVDWLFNTGAGLQLRILNGPGPNHINISSDANPSITVSGGSLALSANVFANTLSVFGPCTLNDVLTLPAGVITTAGVNSLFLQTGGGNQVRVLNGPGPNHLLMQGGPNPSIGASGGSVAISSHLLVGAGMLVNGSGPGVSVSVFRSFDTTTTALSIWQRVDAAISAQMTMLATGEMQFGTTTNHPLTFITAAIERARITTLGYSKFSNSGNYSSIASENHEFVQTNDAGLLICQFVNDAPTVSQQYGIRVYLKQVPNNSLQYFATGIDGPGTERITLLSNGGLRNFQANNANLSDATVKNYWEPYSTVQLEALSAAVNAMDYGRYKYRDQTHDDWNHGYVAQNVREAFRDAAPELVDYWNDGKKDLLAVYSTDLVNISLAVARHEIHKLRAEVEALKARMN